jgi:molybdopterin-guanine dinucleotide biosynthesis protein B
MGTHPVEKKQLVFSVCGLKKTGKTTLVSGVCEILTQKGYHVAVIKHDGHDFEGDVPGTDSWKHMQAGAYGTAVFSPQRFLIQKKCQRPQISFLIGLFPEADIILIEGLKDEDFPKYICSEPAVSAREIPALADRIEKLYEDL